MPCQLDGRFESCCAVVGAQEVSYFDQTAVGDLTSRLGNDCQAVAKVLGINVNVMLRNALQVSPQRLLAT